MFIILISRSAQPTNIFISVIPYFEETIKLLICKEIEIEQNEIIECFGATPKTFLRYINRSSLGGAIMTTKNQLFGLCPNDTPFKGLYCVGDTTFAAQGFPGVIMGVRNLECLI